MHKQIIRPIVFPETMPLLRECKSLLGTKLVVPQVHINEDHTLIIIDRMLCDIDMWLLPNAFH
jgi:hypothetical protein